jgi:uncharacterized membrane protein
MRVKRFTIICITILFILSAILMFRQLVSEAYFSCISDDTYAFTCRAWQFIEALQEGIIYPRWAHLNFWGYGSPAFILYSPLAYYLVAFFSIFTGSLITAMNITKFMALFLSGAGMFFLVKEFYDEKIALLTASFYIVFPYVIFQVYLVGTFYSVISFMWFSPIILFTYRYIKDKQYKDALYAGLCYGGLILTHLISAYMFTFVLVAFIISMAIVKRKPGYLMGIPLIITAGLLISAVYVLPVIFEKQFFTMSAFISYGYNFSDFFILPDMTHKLPQDSLWPVYYNTFVSFILFLIVILILSLILMLKSGRVKTLKDIRSINIFFLCIAIGSLFLLFGFSSFIWVNVPFFKYIQFPYRWLNITTFAVVFLSAVIFYAQDSHHKMKTKHGFFIVVFFLMFILLDYKYINSAHIFTRQSLIPVKAVNWNYEKPKWVDYEKIDKDENIKQTVVIQKGEGSVEVMVWKSAERVIEIKALKPVTLRIRTFYFPGWKAYVDGVQAEIKIEKNIGAMLIDIPKGEHTLIVKFEDTPVRYYSKIISLCSFFSLVFLVMYLKKNW